MNQRTNIKDAGMHSIHRWIEQSTLLEKQTEKKQLVKNA